ncbi:MAG: CRISPR-associated helicase Cas3', partial [Gammaproteobacteria bacterium]
CTMTGAVQQVDTKRQWEGFVRQEGAFWGKFKSDETTTAYLPLAAHCLDVALCFRAFCEIAGLRRSVTRAANRELSPQSLDRLAVLCLLHDLGKANLGFQRKVFDPKAPRAGHVRELAPIFACEAYDLDLYNKAMVALDAEQVAGWFTDEQSAYSYFMAAFSHHGRPLAFSGPRPGNFRQMKQWWQADGDHDPMAAIAELMETARRAFPRAFERGGEPLPAAPQFHHRFAGLAMLADWLGSHPHWFPIEPVAIEARLEADLGAIPRLLRAVGLDRSAYRLHTESFAERFAFAPRPLQTLIDDLDPNDDAHRLLIAESETGSGKTEAAMHWFGKLFASGRVDSLYFALPTRVAARELYRRMVATIERWFPESDTRPVTVLAVPGYAEVDGLPLERRLPDSDEANRWTEDEDQRRNERHWAAEHPKRFLAATIAVGTVDQALLSAVQTAHAHLRSVCLDRALLVVDEVHASDSYMSRLLQHLLRHHLSVGGQAMLLSATLGSVARQMYAAAAGCCDARPLPLDEAIAVPFPALTDAAGTLITATDGRPAATSAERTGKAVKFEPLPIAREPEQIIGQLIDALRRSARVLVVTNTVDRANRLLRAAEAHAGFAPDWLFRTRGVACPHHGRFAPADRTLLDAAVSERLGMNSAAGPLLLIGTQTLEQSLDIDADLLVTDLAPADVLLQRVGRLHRHERPRPQRLRKAALPVARTRPASAGAAGREGQSRRRLQRDRLRQRLPRPADSGVDARRLGGAAAHRHPRTQPLARRAGHPPRPARCTRRAALAGAWPVDHRRGTDEGAASRHRHRQFLAAVRPVQLQRIRRQNRHPPRRR